MTEGKRLLRLLSSSLVVIGKLDLDLRFVEQGDVGDVRLEGLPQLVTHDRKQRTDLELRGQRLADGVDRGQLRHPLAGLVDQVARLQRHAQAGRERGEQRDIPFAERALAIEVLQ